MNEREAILNEIEKEKELLRKAAFIGDWASPFFIQVRLGEQRRALFEYDKRCDCDL